MAWNHGSIDLVSPAVRWHGGSGQHQPCQQSNLHGLPPLALKRIKTLRNEVNFRMMSSLMHCRINNSLWHCRDWGRSAGSKRKGGLVSWLHSTKSWCLLVALSMAASRKFLSVWRKNEICYGFFTVFTLGRVMRNIKLKLIFSVWALAWTVDLIRIYCYLNGRIECLGCNSSHWFRITFC